MESSGDRVVVVCSQENVKSVNEILRHHERYDRARLIVQPYPHGPVEALKLGQELCTTSQMMMLCGDNIVDDLAWDVFSGVKGPPLFTLTVAVQGKRVEDVSRFTLIREEDEEGEELDTPRFVEGKRCVPEMEFTSHVKVWIGPVIFKTSSLTRGLDAVKDFRKPWVFADLFNEILSKDGESLSLVSCRAMDIGVPEALR